MTNLLHGTTAVVDGFYGHAILTGHRSVRFFLDHRDAFAYSNDNPSNPYHYLEPPSRARHKSAQE